MEENFESKGIFNQFLRISMSVVWLVINFLVFAGVISVPWWLFLFVIGPCPVVAFIFGIPLAIAVVYNFVLIVKSCRGKKTKINSDNENDKDLASASREQTKQTRIPDRLEQQREKGKTK